MKKKRIPIAAALLLVLSLTCAIPAAAAEKPTEPSVRVNGYLVEFPDQQPYINADGRTMIPVRAVAEALGADVKWNSDIKGAEITKDGITLHLPIGSQNMTVICDGKRSVVVMDTTAVLKNGRTLVPIRPVAEALGAWVSYSPYYATVQIWDDVLLPEEIDQLHALPLSWEVCNERAPLLAGSSDYENLHECCQRDYGTDYDYMIRNNYTGKTYTNKVDDPQDEIALVTSFAKHAMETQFTREKYGVTASVRTDSSCTFANPASDGYGYINYSYLTLTFAEDADVSGFRTLNKDICDFGDIQPGHTYTYKLESGWKANVAQESFRTSAIILR